MTHRVRVICFTSRAHLYQVLFWEQRKSSLPWPLVISWGHMTSSGQWSVKGTDVCHSKCGHRIPNHGVKGCYMFEATRWWHISQIETLNDYMKQSLHLIIFECVVEWHMYYIVLSHWDLCVYMMASPDTSCWTHLWNFYPSKLSHLGT